MTAEGTQEEREIESHKVGTLNDKCIRVFGYQNHEVDLAPTVYEVTVIEANGLSKPTLLQFQDGPLQDAGANGITNEALLAVVVDRLQHFQKGKFSCRENAIAITKLEEALLWLGKRYKDRAKRGVEGKREV